MRNVIRQSVVLPAAAARLFEMYIDPDCHAAITGRPVTIGLEQGAEFRAFDGQISGMILAVIPPRLLVQSWRSAKFGARQADSTLILTFTPEGEGGRIDLVHLGVPAHEYDDVVEGWEKYYWTPWRAYLKGQ